MTETTSQNPTEQFSEEGPGPRLFALIGIPAALATIIGPYVFLDALYGQGFQAMFDLGFLRYFVFPLPLAALVIVWMACNAWPRVSAHPALVAVLAVTAWIAAVPATVELGHAIGAQFQSEERMQFARMEICGENAPGCLTEDTARFISQWPEPKLRFLTR